jgi:hypothetical protein
MSHPSTAMRPFGDPLAIVRYVDVAIVVLAAPFIVLMGAPVLGYVAGAAAWIVNRAVGTAAERVARKKTDVRAAIGLNMGTLLLRAWIVALTILVVGLAGRRQDGLMAAVLLLVAFTVYFAMSLIVRPLEGRDSKR